MSDSEYLIEGLARIAFLVYVHECRCEVTQSEGLADAVAHGAELSAGGL
jgi:hypothetical protein